jgi:hypothetical protein
MERERDGEGERIREGGERGTRMERIMGREKDRERKGNRVEAE